MTGALISYEKNPNSEFVFACSQLTQNGIMLRRPSSPKMLSCIAEVGSATNQPPIDYADCMVMRRQQKNLSCQRISGVYEQVMKRLQRQASRCYIWFIMLE